MDSLVTTANPAPGSTHIELRPTRGKAPKAAWKLYRGALSSISLFARVPEGNFHRRGLRAFWRNAADRPALRQRGWSNTLRLVKRPANRVSFLMLQSASSSIETKASWAVATVALITMLMAFGAAWITAVALKDIAAEVGGVRSVPALASALAWLGSGVGGILMGRIANRVGTRWTVLCGSLMIALGLTISTFGPPWPLWVGHGFFIGLIGLGGINAPMYIYVSRWFDRRRGSALALISSGSYLAGAMWPPVFERAIGTYGWRETMLWYAFTEIVVIIPLALIYFQAPPELALPAAPSDSAAGKARVLGWSPNVVFGVMCVAAVLCCVPMAMPQGHLVAFCSDLGISGSIGALMLSVLLGTAFLSRQIWGAISDRIGGLA